MITVRTITMIKFMQYILPIYLPMSEIATLQSVAVYCHSWRELYSLMGVFQSI